MPIAVRADLQARLKEQAYTRLFTRTPADGVDTTFADLCLAEAESEFLMITEAAFPSGFTAPVDVAIVGAICDLACLKAASRHLSASEMSGYDLAGRRALAFAQRLAADAKNRPTTGQLPAPLATATAPTATAISAPFWGGNDPSRGWSGF